MPLDEICDLTDSDQRYPTHEPPSLELLTIVVDEV